MANVENIEYDQRWDGAVDCLIKDGEYNKTKIFGIEVIEPQVKEIVSHGPLNN